MLFFIIQTIRTFNNEWGSGRGVIWIYTFKLFDQMSFGEKLIGLGPETLRMYNTEINEIVGGWVLTNHSDFLQLLVTNGLLGLTAWIAMWASIVVKQIKSKVIEDDAFIFFICLMAYLGQSTVFTMECLCWPMLIVVMGLFLRYYKERTKLQG